MPTKVKKILKKEVKQRVEKACQAMPFQETPRVHQPRCMKDRQQSWVLSGLKHLGAPMVTCMANAFVGGITLYTWDTLGVGVFLGSPPMEVRFISGSGNAGVIGVCHSQPPVGQDD